MHHAKWGDPTKRHMGVGVVEWHSLTEDGKVEVCDIRFGDKLFEDVPVSQLKPIRMKEHSHNRKPKRKKKNEDMNTMKEMLDQIILSKLKESNSVTESKDKLIGGQGTRKGKLMLYQKADGTFYMTLKGKEAKMEPGLVKNRSDAIKAASMFAKMINNT